MVKPKNHFLISYAGNKKDETADIIEAINFDKIENIIEPFCGSSAISYNIWLKYGDKFKYFLNDYDEELINVYNLLKEKDVEEIENEVNKIKDEIKTKDDWIKKLNEYKQTKNIFLYIFFIKYSSMGRLGFYKKEKIPKIKFKISEEQKKFIKFIKEPYVEITNNDWLDVFNKYKDDKKSIFIFDPPYMFSENGFYLSKKSENNVYEYFYKNTKHKSNIYFILENIWINEAIFKNLKNIKTYKKMYELSKKKTEHIIYYNKG